MIGRYRCVIIKKINTQTKTHTMKKNFFAVTLETLLVLLIATCIFTGFTQFWLIQDQKQIQITK